MVWSETRCPRNVDRAEMKGRDGEKVLSDILRPHGFELKFHIIIRLRIIYCFIGRVLHWNSLGRDGDKSPMERSS